MARLPFLVRDFARSEVRRSRPTVLVMAPTNRCNAGCSFCLDFPRDPPQTMSLAQFDTILAKLAPDLELVDFSFYGEPMLNSSLPEMIRHARACGLGTILYTNGLLLDDGRIRALADSGIEVVVINLNAWGDDQRVVDVDGFPAARVEQVSRLVRACAPRTLVVLQVLTRPGGRGCDLRALARRFPDPGNRLLRLKPEQRFAYERGRAASGRVRCLRPFEEIAVAPDGVVALCCKDMLRRSTFGNLLSEDLDEIWIRRMNVARRDNRADLCLRCEAPGDPRRVLANVLLSPLDARRLYLRVGSSLGSRMPRRSRAPR
ncbi:MAG TPA: radical SAM protein [Polyangia bacterium]